MRRLLAGVVVAAALIPASARAVDFENGNQLYERCVEPGGTFSEGMCYGYVVGITDALGGGASIAGSSACIPVGVKIRQVMDIAKQFLTAHPEKRQNAADGLVAEALERAFPCKR
jgi:Rap1a immunity proteins